MTERTGSDTAGRRDRRAYRTPSLVDYGAVAKLTQGSGPANGDGGQGMMS